MAKYIIDVPKNWVDITNGLHIPLEKCGNVGNLRIDTGLELTSYTEQDEQEIRKRVINEVCSKFAANEFYYGDDLKSAFICMAEGKEVGQVKCFFLGEAGDEIRQKVEDEVWEFAWEVLQLDLPVFREIFGYDTDKMDYREYKSKYEAWLKQKDEIHIGDEVIPLDTQYDTMVVTKLWTSVCHDEWVDAIASDGKFYSFLKTSIKKTGRHFNEVEELLRKMEEK